MEKLDEKVKKVVADLGQRLDRQHIPYLIDGGLAMGFYAVPRLTRDIDLVVQLAEADVDRFLTEFPNYYFHRDSIREENPPPRDV
jgi:hypothetical protein